MFNLEMLKEVEEQARKSSRKNLPEDKYVKWFSELSNKDVGVAGGKGASLGEMFNAGINVPPGFVVTAQSFDIFLSKSGIKEKIHEILDEIDIDDTDELNKKAREIREMILRAEMLKDMEKEIIEAYEDLGAEDKRGASGDAMNILRTSHESIFVAVRSSATTEDLETASFAGQQDSFVNVKGEKKLIEHVKKCFASLFTARAIYYRVKKGFEHKQALLAVVVQKMVDSKKSGVVFTKEPVKKTDDVLIEAVFGLGEGIVSGKIKPDSYLVSRELEILEKNISNKKIAITRNSAGEKEEVKLTEQKSKQQVLTKAEISELAEQALKIEEHYKKPQDIEFAIDSGIYIVQSRPITTLTKHETGKEIEGKVLLSGLGASPGVASGEVKIVGSMKDLAKVKKGDVLVTEMTNPDMVVTMQKASAIVTDEGGVTSHAAIVSREMGIPAVVGTESATKVLKDGMKISVDGSRGKVYEGAVKRAEKKEIQAVVETKTKIKVMVDLPDFAVRAVKTGCEGVGLLRLEGIIASSGKHPMMFLAEGNIDDYTKLIEKGIEKISKYFQSVWIRTSDIRSDEYRNLKGAPKEQEANPMLGFHGIRFSLKNKELFEAELQAVRNVAGKNEDKEFGIMFPQIISADEFMQAKKFFDKFKIGRMKIGVMVETPAACMIIDELCDGGVEFVSFGTNDLTQYTLAVDRGNENVQYIYDEMHPSVLREIERVIETCKNKNVETSICGQAGSEKDMVKFLVEKGIDSISVNADVAKEISEYVAELEKNLAVKSDVEAVEEEKSLIDKPVNLNDEEDGSSVNKDEGYLSDNESNKKEEFPEIDLGGFDVFAGSEKVGEIKDVDDTGAIEENISDIKQEVEEDKEKKEQEKEEKDEEIEIEKKDLRDKENKDEGRNINPFVTLFGEFGDVFDKKEIEEINPFLSLFGVFGEGVGEEKPEEIKRAEFSSDENSIDNKKVADDNLLIDKKEEIPEQADEQLIKEHLINKERAEQEEKSDEQLVDEDDKQDGGVGNGVEPEEKTIEEIQKERGDSKGGNSEKGNEEILDIF